MATAASLYAIAAGLLILGWWANDLRRGAWQRGDRSHSDLAVLMAAEGTTATALVMTGIAVLVAGRAGLVWLAFALGVLLYNAVIGPGYFEARRSLPAAGGVAALFVLTLPVLAVTLRAVA